MLRSCWRPSRCGRLSRPRSTTTPPSRPRRISRQRAFPGCHQQPGASGALPTFTMIRLTGLATGSTPTALPPGTRSVPSVTAPKPESRAWSAPPSNKAAPLLSTTHVRQVSGRFRNRGASTTTLLSLRLSVSLARTRASGSAARPSRCRGRSRRRRALPRRDWPPASPGRCISPGPALQPVRMRCCSSVISFRMAPRGARSTFSASRTCARRPGTDGSSSSGSRARRRCGQSCTGGTGPFYRSGRTDSQSILSSGPGQTRSSSARS